jgi:hypothetical protein
MYGGFKHVTADFFHIDTPLDVISVGQPDDKNVLRKIWKNVTKVEKISANSPLHFIRFNTYTMSSQFPYIGTHLYKYDAKTLERLGCSKYKNPNQNMDYIEKLLILQHEEPRLQALSDLDQLLINYRKIYWIDVEKLTPQEMKDLGTKTIIINDDHIVIYGGFKDTYWYEFTSPDDVQAWSLNLFEDARPEVVLLFLMLYGNIRFTIHKPTWDNKLYHDRLVAWSSVNVTIAPLISLLYMHIATGQNEACSLCNGCRRYGFCLVSTSEEITRKMNHFIFGDE